jgi:hypothetical protein
MRVVTACGALVLSLVVHAQHGPWIVADTESHLAEVVVRSDADRVLVMLDTVLDASSQPDGLTEQWYVLQTGQPSQMADHLARALVVVTPSSVRVSDTAGKRYEFLISGADRTSAAGDSGTGNVTRVVGFGLAHFSVAANVPLVADAVSVAAMWEWRFSGGEACLSGGPGATQCSAADGRFACAVTCATGYEACCGQRAAVCGCQKATTCEARATASKAASANGR